MGNIIEKPSPAQFYLTDFQPIKTEFHAWIGSDNVPDVVKHSTQSQTGIGVPFKGWWVDICNVIRLLNKYRIYSYRNLIKAISSCVFEEVCHYLGFLHSNSAHYADLERTWIHNLHGFHTHSIRGWEFHWLFSDFTNYRDTKEEGK